MFSEMPKSANNWETKLCHQTPQCMAIAIGTYKTDGFDALILSL